MDGTDVPRKPALHSARIGHRVANTGSAPLHFAACWPSDAGHDYDSIRKYGFGARLMKVDGKAKLVESAS